MKKRDFRPILLYIITAVLLLLAYLSLVTGGRAVWLVVAAVITLVAGFSFAEKGFIKKNIETLKYSFEHLHWNLILIVLCDVLLLVMVSTMIYQGGMYLNSLSVNIQSSTNIMEVLAMNDPAAMNEILGDVFGLLKALIVIAFLITVASLILYSILKGIIWELSYSRKPSAPALIRFFLLNLIWLPLIFLVIIIFARGFNQAYVSQLLLVPLAILFHMTVVLNGVFVHTGKIWKAIGRMFVVAFKRFRYFVIPYFLVILLYFAVINLSILLGPIDAMTQLGIMVGLILPLTLAVGRVYIAQVIKENI